MTQAYLYEHQGDFDTKQQDILEAIYRLYVEDSEPVVIRTIEARVDITNNAIARRLRALERDGYIWRDKKGVYGKWYLSLRGLKQVSPNPEKGSYEHKRYKFLTELARQAKSNVVSL